MDGVAVTDRTKDGSACIVDRSASEPLHIEGRTGASSLCPSPAEPALSRPQETPDEATRAEAEVVLQQLWFELPVPDRQRFGHCFSCMVLKALGLRPCPPEGVKA
jgi:hypothetical protein